MIPLSVVDVGEKNCIYKITGKDEVRQHLAEMGFVIGEEIVIVSKIMGNVIISVKGSRVALDRDMANRILV